MMKVKETLINCSFWILLVLHGCMRPNTDGSNLYMRHVGDSTFDETKDDPAFATCHGDERIFQYFNLGEGPVYPREKKAFFQKFQKAYRPIQGSGQSGFIRIRFVVNCKGKAGRFRVLQSDFNYQEKKFDPDVIQQLLDITKNMESWVVLNEKGKPADYYFYLVFKLEDGQLTELLP